MHKLVAFGHRRPGRPMVSRFDQEFFRHGVAGRITPVRHIDHPADHMIRANHLTDRFLTAVLVFLFGVLAGYLWAAAAYGHLAH